MTSTSPHVETRLGVCNLCEAICGLGSRIDGRPGHRRSAATRTTRSRAGTSAPRASRSPTSTTTPTGCAAPYAAWRGRRRATWEEIGWDEALDLVADRLARAVNDARPRRRRRLPRQPQRAQPRLADPRRRRCQARSAPATVQRHLGRPAPRTSSWPGSCYGHQLLLPIPDLDRTSYFLVLGANPLASNGTLMTAPDFPQPGARRSRRAAAGWS